MNKVGYVKRYDKDLELFRDLAKTLQEYRISVFGTYSIKKWNKIKDKHKQILKRLANRLNIKTLDKNWM